MAKRIGIIGGGASGVLTAIQIGQKLGREAEIIIFEPAEKLGRGKAYSAKSTEDILNVPAGKMSAYPDVPAHFSEWVLSRDPKIQESRHWPFVPRSYFGDYLEEQLHAIPNWVHVRAKVASVVARPSEYEVTCEDGAKLRVDYLVVATGYVNPPGETEAVLPGEHVLIVGTGLTALDAWRRLRKSPDATFTFVSRRGLFPEPHADPMEVEVPALAGMSPLQILQVLRCLKKSRAVSWAALADRVRPQAQKIWTCWTDQERARFARHVKPYWEVIRHRMPRTVAEDLRQDLEAGRIRVLAGRVRVEENAEGFLARVLVARREEALEIRASRMIVATGSLIQTELFRKTPLSGVRLCPHGFGYVNESAPRLWFVGPSSKAVYWEITAVPDIREQAASVADNLSKDQSPGGSLVIQRISTHPDSVGESYLAHFKASSSFALRMWRLGWYAMVHAFVPFLHLDTTSSHLRNLSPVLSRRRQRQSGKKAFQLA